MSAEWIDIGTAWPRRGLMYPSEHLLQCLTTAFQLPVDTPEGPADPALFIEQCLKWVYNSTVHTIAEQAVEQGLIVMQPVWRPLTICHIEVNRSAEPGIGVRLHHAKELTAEWRWAYYNPAFTWFWALLFHETSAMLAEPEYIWRELERNSEFFQRWERDSTEDTARLQYYLALYERILGIISDIREVRTHYRDNIINRPELDLVENMQRRERFDGTISFLRQKLEQILTEALLESGS